MGRRGERAPLFAREVYDELNAPDSKPAVLWTETEISKWIKKQSGVAPSREMRERGTAYS